MKSHPIPGHLGRIPANVIYSIQNGERLTSPQPHSGPTIIATGCSFTFGQGLNDQDTWPWLLQERLPDARVVNVSAMGYGTDQALLAAEKEAARFSDVHMVVLGFGDFQIDRNRSPEKWLATLYPFGKPLFVRKGDEAEDRGLVKFWSFGSGLDKFLDGSALLSPVVNLSLDRIHHVEAHEGGRQLTIALIKTFAARFQSRGIQLIVVVLPHKWDYAPQSQADRAFVVDELKRAGVLTVAVNIPRLPNGRIDPAEFMVGTHPNGKYNSLLVDQLMQFLSVPAALNHGFTLTK